MLNWPGRKSKPAAGSISSVQMSAPSRRTRLTRSMTGSIGSAPGEPAAPSGAGALMAASAGLAIDIKHLEPCRLQPFDEDRHEPHHHRVAEIVILVALVAETLGIDADGADEVERARVVSTAVGRDQPGNADHVAFRHGLEGDGGAAGSGKLESDAAVADQIELVRRVAFAKEIFAGVEADVARTARHELDQVLTQARKELVLADDFVHSLDHVAA